MAINLWQSVFETLTELRFAPREKRLRVFRGGDLIADTTSALLVWEPRRIVPEYAVPVTDLLVDLVPAEPAEQPDALPEVMVPGNFGWHSWRSRPPRLPCLRRTCRLAGISRARTSGWTW